MFGQPSNTSFGAFNTASQSSPFGQTAFGKPITTTSFGSGAAPVFGSTNTSLFSAKPAGTTAGGLFGTTTATPAFGQPNTTQSSFGGFGSTNTNTNLFGTQPNANTSLFGSNTTTSAFGQAANKPGGFGGFGSTTANTLFGQPQQQQQQTTPFGQTSTTGNTSLFGTTGGFGSNNTVAGITGTVVKFNPVTGSDTMVKGGVTQTISTKHHCITCMKEYESKSLEELRLEDYQAGRKGSTQAAGTNLFGTPAQSSPFGTATAGTSTGTTGFGTMTTGFGTTNQAGSTGLFGKPMTGFGTPATTANGFPFNSSTSNSLFGTNNQVKPFGAAAPTPLFASTNTNQTTATGFGNITTPQNTGFGSTFGTTQPNQSIGLFNANKPAFNIPASSSGTGFPNFGQTSTGNTGTNLFGTKTTGTTGFGTSSFGVPPTSTFGTNTGFNVSQNTGSSLFNSSFKPAGQTSGFSFPTSSASSSLGLGTNTGLNLTSGSSLFGTQKPGSLFGTPGTNTTFSNPGGFGNTSTFGTNTNTGTGLGMGLMSGGMSTNQTQTTGTVPVHQQILALVSAPFGDSPLLKNLLPASGKAEELLKPTNTPARNLSNSQFKVTPNNKSPKLKTRVVSSAQLSKKSIFDGLEEEDPILSEAFQPRVSAKRLVLRPKSSSSQDMNSKNDNINLTTENVVTENSINEVEPTNKENHLQDNRLSANDRRSSTSWLRSSIPRKEREVEDDSFDGQRSPFSGKNQSAEAIDNTVAELRAQINSPNLSRSNLNTSIDTSSNSLADKTRLDFTVQSADLTHENDDSTWANLQNISTPNAANIILRRAGYYTLPALDELDEYVSSETCIVNGFTVGRKGYGNVYFPDTFDIYGLNLDEIVHFRHKEVIIYPDDEKKPPVGQGLNRKAQVTLDRVWPHDKSLHEPITDPKRLAEMNYEAKLRRVCAKHDTRFCEYRPETGSWVFKVDHFSKYGLSDSDEEDAPPVTDPKKKMLDAVQKPVTASQFKKLVKLQEKYPEKKIIDDGLKNVKKFSDVEKLMSMGGENFEDSSNLHIDDDYMIEKPTTLSPTATVARITGTDSHRLQLMKSNFFEMEDDYTNQNIVGNGYKAPTLGNHYLDTDSFFHTSVQKNNFFNTSKIGNLSLPAKEISFDSLSVPMEEERIFTEQHEKLNYFVEDKSKSSALSKLSLPDPMPSPLTVVLKSQSEMVPLEDSIIHKSRFHCVADLGIQMGRMFRSSWGPGLTLLSLSTQNQATKVELENVFSKLGTYVSGRSNNDTTSSTIVQRIRILGGGGADEHDIQAFRESIEGHLKIQLNHCVIEKDGNCPRIEASSKSSEKMIYAIHEHSALAEELASQRETDRMAVYINDVFNLCVALWGNLPELDPEGGNTMHKNVIVRREAVGEWLKGVIERDTNEMKTINDQNEEEYIFSLLCSLRLEEACKLATSKGNYCLSLLLSQLRSGASVRELMKQQLALWQDTEVDEKLSIDRLKLFMLVAAEPLIISKHGTINVCEGLDWKKAFAMHLWYLSSPTCSIADVLEIYDTSFTPMTTSVAYAAKPEPDYKEMDFDVEMCNGDQVYDLCYQLLKLYCCGNHPLNKILNPLAYTPDPLDYRLSWLIQEILMGLGYTQISEYTVALTHTNFATQLEAYGLWHWSIFVMLHLPESGKRKSAVMGLLERHVSIDENPEYEEQEAFLVGDLSIPSVWIDYAKAIKCRVAKRYGEAAWYFIKANEWNFAHDIIIDHIGADAIINENYDYLLMLLRPMISTECNSKISGWSYQGQLLWDYIEITMKIKEILRSTDACELTYKLKSMKPQLTSLCSRINMFPCPTDKHRLCQAEIAKRTLHLAKTFLSSESQSTTKILIQLVSQLPLPEDYAQQELRPIVNMCVNEIMTQSL